MKSDINSAGSRWRHVGKLLGGAYASFTVAEMIRKGEIPPAKRCACVDCGDTAEHYDHRNYNRPKRVVPVCRTCNFKRGPATPIHGSLGDALDKGVIPYRKLTSVVSLFKRNRWPVAPLKSMPKILTLAHWYQLRELRPEWFAKGKK